MNAEVYAGKQFVTYDNRQLKFAEAYQSHSIDLGSGVKLEGQIYSAINLPLEEKIDSAFGEPNIVFLAKLMKDFCMVLILVSVVVFGISLISERSDLTLASLLGVFAFTLAFTISRSVLSKLRHAYSLVE